MSYDRLRLPQRFASIFDGQKPHHILLRVFGGATILWSAEVMSDGEGQMFPHNGWRRFARSHTIDVEHFVVFQYDCHNEFNVTVFNETMCRRHYHSDENN
ncbi:hypothetical protein QYE76_052281 [Lolium multiflorum]|uniref:TF-B3 domain-containing protein n=1 Tax=Lolium multiflorum TaxID=4521 RepID=A0AAD8STP4_LOLMU|nr:hypothetical protein QYE76_052281 [Lolium multiflorum]